MNRVSIVSHNRCSCYARRARYRQMPPSLEIILRYRYPNTAVYQKKRYQLIRWRKSSKRMYTFIDVRQQCYMQLWRLNLPLKILQKADSQKNLLKVIKSNSISIILALTEQTIEMRRETSKGNDRKKRFELDKNCVCRSMDQQWRLDNDVKNTCWMAIVRCYQIEGLLSCTSLL